jgi:hypothetical protein
VITDRQWRIADISQIYGKTDANDPERKLNGAAQASDSALTTASAELKWRNGWSAAATFEGEFSEVTRSYGGKGVVRYAW